ncbi:MAG TPA: glucose 1-dehydrogenase [Terriglobia bacterium]|nr:glucose 1-dehydrogenase [Terriglobia bacterium]
MSLEGRGAIVTGAGQGLGLAIARKFLAEGARVLLVDREPEVSARVGEADLRGGSAFALVKDLADEDAAPVVFQKALAALGRVDTLVNNAGWSLHKPLAEMTVAEFDRLVAVNQRAPYFLAQEFLRNISQSPRDYKDPAIVNIASVNALAGNCNLTAYAGTKGALVASARAMAAEMAPFGIRVNCISPGAVLTPMTQKVIGKGTIDTNTFFDPFLVKRFASCEEIAELVAYLCSPAATYVTGVNWVIDGGYTAQ